MIYFACSLETGNIKIGFSGNVRHRLNQLTTQYGKMALLGVLPGGRPFEVALHMAFSAHLVPGMGREWFYDTEPIQKYIARYAKPLEAFKTQAPLEPPTRLRDGVNCHLFDLIVKKRQEPGFWDFGLDELEQATDVPIKRLRLLAKNETEVYVVKEMDALLEFFDCGYGDMLKLSHPQEEVPPINHS